MGLPAPPLPGVRHLDLKNPETLRSLPAPVLNASWMVKSGVALGLPTSSYAVYAILLLLKGPASLALRWGMGCAAYCAIAVFIFCWSFAAAYVVRKCNLSLITCGWAGVPFLLLWITLLGTAWFGTGKYTMLGNGQLLVWSNLSFVVGLASALSCRKLAYPGPLR
jgi:hypothetical protein